MNGPVKRPRDRAHAVPLRARYLPEIEHNFNSSQYVHHFDPESGGRSWNVEFNPADEALVAAGTRTSRSTRNRPPLGSILHLHEVPPHGGDTLFANMYAAYDALSEPIRNLLDGLTARHESDYAGYYGDHPPQRDYPRASHPVVRTHPVTGRRALYVNAGFTRRIEGLRRSESTALLDFLFEHVKNPAFQCRFRWEPHSLAMWDNRCVHMAVWDYHPETRSGLRVTVKGDRPFH